MVAPCVGTAAGWTIVNKKGADSESFEAEPLEAEPLEAEQEQWQLLNLRLDRKWLIALLVLGGISFAALLALGGGRDAVDAVLQADRWAILAALLIHYSGFAVRGLRWQRLLAIMGNRLPYLYCTALLISGWFVSAIIPARAGDILRVGILRSPLSPKTPQAPNGVLAKRPVPSSPLASRRSATQPARRGENAPAKTAQIHPIPISDGVSSIVLERLLDMAAILLLGASFGFVLLRTQLPGWVLGLYGTVIGLLGLFGVALLILPRLWGWLRGLIDHGLWHKLIDFGTDMVERFRQLLSAPWAAGGVLLMSLYIWLCDAFLLWFVMGSLGEWIGFGPAAFVALTVDVVAAVPLTPGGIGQIETGYAALLSLMSLPVVKVSVIILLTRAISYWSFLLFSGLVAFFFGARQFVR